MTLVITTRDCQLYNAVGKVRLLSIGNTGLGPALTPRLGVALGRRDGVSWARVAGRAWGRGRRMAEAVARLGWGTQAVPG